MGLEMTLDPVDREATRWTIDKLGVKLWPISSVSHNELQGVYNSWKSVNLKSVCERLH